MLPALISRATAAAKARVLYECRSRSTRRCVRQTSTRHGDRSRGLCGINGRPHDQSGLERFMAKRMGAKTIAVKGVTVAYLST